MSTVVENEELRSKIQPRIKQFTKLVEEIRIHDENNEYTYLTYGMSKLFRMMEDCEQYNTEIDPDGDAVLVDKVIRIYRYIPNYLLDMHAITHVVVDGLYIEAPVYLLPSNKCDKAFVKRYKSILDPVAFGLPDNDVVDYSTIKPFSSSAYIALAKFNGNYLNEVIKRVSNYDCLRFS